MENPTSSDELPTPENKSSQPLLKQEDENTESVKAQRSLTWRLCLATFACVISTSFQFGWQTGVLNTPQQLLQNEYRYDFNQPLSSATNTTQPPVMEEVTLLWALTVSIFGVGGMIGGFTGSYLATRFGRKKLMLYDNPVLLLGCVFMIIAKYAAKYQLLIVGRFIVGIHSGFSTVVAPLYLNEIAPVNLRGAFGVVHQLAITTAIVLSQTFGISPILGTVDGYVWLFVFPLFCGMIQVVLLPFCPESPAWLYIEKHDKDASTEALQKLLSVKDVSAELAQYEQEVQKQSNQEKVTYKDMFTRRWLRVPLLIALLMHCSQQFSGIIAVLNYSTSIFTSTGLDENSAQYATIGSTAVIVIMTIVSIFIIDRVGRRPLHITGLGGCLISTTILTIALALQTKHEGTKYLSICALILFIMSFAIGPGSIPWFITAELFDQSARGHAISIATLVNWFANFFNGLIFPPLQEALGIYCFIPYVCLLVVFLIFTIIKLPETKNKSVAEITALFSPPTLENEVNVSEKKL